MIIMLGNYCVPEVRQPMHLLDGHLLVLLSLGISHHNPLFNHYFINYNEVSRCRMACIVVELKFGVNCHLIYLITSHLPLPFFCE